MPNTAPSRADPVVIFPLSRWCPPQETSQPHSSHHMQQNGTGSILDVNMEWYKPIPGWYIWWFKFNNQVSEAMDSWVKLYKHWIIYQKTYDAKWWHCCNHVKAIIFSGRYLLSMSYHATNRNSVRYTRYINIYKPAKLLSMSDNNMSISIQAFHLTLPTHHPNHGACSTRYLYSWS